jgi:hypothetical protein
MTIRQRGTEGICSAEFWIDGKFYQFSFNGKKGMPLITSKRKARDREDDLKRQIKAGTFMQASDLRNFAKFFDEIYMDYSRKHKTPLATEFDESFGKRLLLEFGERTLGQISPQMIEDYLINFLKTRPHSPVTVRRHYNMLNQLFNMAIRERVIEDNPCRLVTRTVSKELPTWQNRDRWLNKYSSDEEDRSLRPSTNTENILPPSLASF